MSSLGEWMDAMVRLRGQKAQEEQFKARQEAAMYQSLGEGVGGLLGGLGKSQEQAKNDAIANQLMNRQSPPRAMAVDPSLQGPADTAAASMPGGPMTEGGPFTGGVEGFKMQGMLDKQALAQEKARAAQELGVAKFGQAGAEYDLRQRNVDSQIAAREASTQAAEARLELRKQQADQTNQVNAARLSLSQASPKYQQDLKDSIAYQQQMKVALAAAAGAKTPEEYDRAVSLITSNYSVGEKHGYKVKYPEIPIPGYQREAAQATQADIQRLQGQKEAAWEWTGGKDAIQSQISLKQKQLPEGYDPNYTPPGLQPWDIPEPPNLDDYLKPAQQELNQAAQPQQQQPSQQGGGSEQTISLEEARKNKPNVQSGDVLTDKFGNRVRVQ